MLNVAGKINQHRVRGSTFCLSIPVHVHVQQKAKAKAKHRRAMLLSQDVCDERTWKLVTTWPMVSQMKPEPCPAGRSWVDALNMFCGELRRLVMCTTLGRFACMAILSVSRKANERTMRSCCKDAKYSHAKQC